MGTLQSSKAFGTQAAKKPHLVRDGKGGLAGEIGDLRSDIETAFRSQETRTGYPTITSLPQIPKSASAQDFVITGAGFNQSQTKDSLAVTSGTGIITFTALFPGDSGMSITILTAAGGAEVIAYNAITKVISITPRIGATAANVVASVNADTTVNKLVTCVVTAAGAGFSTAVANAVMTGGTGQTAGGWAISVNGVAQYPKAGQATDMWADSSITISLSAADLVAMTYGSTVLVTVTANGITEYATTTVGAAAEMAITFAGDGVPKDSTTPGSMELEGTNLLQGTTFDALTLWATTSAVTITSLLPGDTSYTIEITDGAVAGFEVVTKTSNVFVVQIEAGVSSANQIAAAINANGEDSDGYLRATSGGAGTTNAIAAAAPMTGGVGTIGAITIGGQAILPANTTGATGAAAWTDTAVTAKVTTTALLAVVVDVGNMIDVKVTANGVSDSVTVPVYASTAPVLNWIDPAPPAAGGDFIIKGAGLLQGQTFDSFALTEGASTVTITAVTPGDSGITVTVTTGAAGVTYNPGTKLLTITNNAGVTDDDALATLINANGADSDGYLRAVSAGGAAAYTAASDQVATAMTGGVGDYDNNIIRVGGVVTRPSNTANTTSAAKWSNTQISCTFVAAGTNADSMGVEVTTDTAKANVLAATLT